MTEARIYSQVKTTIHQWDVRQRKVGNLRSKNRDEESGNEWKGCVFGNDCPSRGRGTKNKPIRRRDRW